MSEKVKKFIESHWDECIKENREDEDTLIGMPYPYIVPAVGHFDEMYYWDTYFTNKGLELCGRMQQVKNNTDDMLYLVKKYGFMPNGNRTYYLLQSQPPFLSGMVRDVYDYYKDTVWLSAAYDVLKIEYNFWMSKRITPIGLNCYACICDEGRVEGLSKCFERRAGYMPEGDKYLIALHCGITCESGWDINPRWGIEGYNYAPVDLNSLMYMFEDNMAYFSGELGRGEEALWKERAAVRRERMIRYMEDENGLLMDYNFETGRRSEIFSVASLYPLYVGLAETRHAKAAAENLYRLEADYGVFTCEKNDTKGTFQWDYPNGWACLQYIAIIGFDKYKYFDIAQRLAKKYLTLVEKVFDETGNLWEKYNVEDGSLNVSNEYEMPAMMGWSAGVYLAAENYLINKA